MNLLTGKKASEISTLIKLYEEIAKVKSTVDFCDVEIIENPSTTIQSQYKAHFLEDEWKNICYLNITFKIITNKF